MFLPKILSSSAPIYVNTFKSISGQFWKCKAFWYSLLDQLCTLNDEPLQMDLTLHIFERTSYFLLITCEVQYMCVKGPSKLQGPLVHK